MTNKQVQEAGDNSQQFQVGSITVINNGIDEKRAREIFQEMNTQLRREYTQDALELANSRIAEFENRLLPKMEAAEGALEAFADPGFQLLLVEAQKRAAATERPADYDLLSELLLHRFQKGTDRTVRTGVNRAVEIVADISDEALLGLTVFHSVTGFQPRSGFINEGLNVLDDLFRKVIYGNLPVGTEWLDHLDILDAIRISNFGNLKKIEQLYPERLSGYIDVGIEKTSEDYNEAIELLKINGLPQNILIEHELNTSFVRVNLLDKKDIDSLALTQQISNNGQLTVVTIPLSDKQKDAIRTIYDFYNKDANTRQQNVNKFMEEWNKHPNLKKT